MGARKRQRPRKSLAATLKRIRLFATDVDGVLTDAGMYYSESGEELKKFNTRDGMGIKLLQRAGLITAIVTQERTKLVAWRGEKLMMPEVHQGVMDKLSLVREMAARHGLSMDEVAYIGDDINDLATLKAVGFSATPADGMPYPLNDTASPPSKSTDRIVASYGSPARCRRTVRAGATAVAG